MEKTLKNILMAGICIVSGVVGGNLLQSKTIAEPPISNYKSYSIRDNSIKRHNFSHQKTGIESPNLLLNRDDQIYFVTNKNEEQGINDIKKIINNSNYEEAWVYLPEKQKWFEVGFDSYTLSKKFAMVSSNKNDINKILEKNKDIKELIFYHNHPSFPDDSQETEKFPPFFDIRIMVDYTLSFPDYKIKNKICSKYGITEYSLTEKAKKDFKSEYYNKQNDPEYFNVTFKPFKK